MQRAIREVRITRQLPDTLLEVEQIFDTIQEPDVEAATRRALAECGALARLKPGDSVAVGAGSRGITNMARIARAAVAELKAHGARPFIVAAMGSHGGATAPGQREMLASLGMTEESVGCEFRITMDVKQIGQIEGGPPLTRICSAPPPIIRSCLAASSHIQIFARRSRAARPKCA